MESETTRDSLIAEKKKWGAEASVSDVADGLNRPERGLRLLKRSGRG